tara:strand:- start:1680 stop:3146 length:1467 start_codon:yes stop_codon:yes gene_type:complete
MKLLIKKYFNFFEQNLLNISIIILFILTLITLVAALNGFPISIGDKEGFYPVIHNIKTVNEFSHPFMCYTCEERIGNPLNEKFTNHGFLYPLVHSFFLFFDEYEKIETGSTIIFLINGILFILLIGINNLKSFVIFIISLSFFLYQIGRPELLISSILIIDWFITKKNYFNYPEIFLSLISAVLFCINPLSLILYFPYIAIKNHHFKIDSNYYINYKYFLLTPFFIFICFFLAVDQFLFIDWIKGMINASKHYHPASLLSDDTYSKYGHTSLNEYWTYFIKGPRFLPLVFLCFLSFYISLINNCLGSDKKYKFFVIIFLLLITWFGLRRPIFLYNVYAFVPFILLILNFDNNFISKLSKIFLSFFFLLCSVSIIFYSMFIPFITILVGNDVKTLKNSILKTGSTKTIQMSKMFWMHSQKGDNIRVITSSINNTKIFDADVIYFSSLELRYINEQQIPEIKGYCIKEIKLQSLKIKLYDYSYIKFIKCS